MTTPSIPPHGQFRDSHQAEVLRAIRDDALANGRPANCPRCEGNGIVTMYWLRSGETGTDTCRLCQGTGQYP